MADRHLDADEEGGEDDGLDDSRYTATEAAVDLLTSKRFWEPAERLVDKILSARADVVSRNYRLFLWGAILRYALSATVLGCVVYLFYTKALTELAAMPLLTAIVASLFIPPKTGV